jgi:hypothetical protein
MIKYQNMSNLPEDIKQAIARIPEDEQAGLSKRVAIPDRRGIQRWDDTMFAGYAGLTAGFGFLTRGYEDDFVRNIALGIGAILTVVASVPPLLDRFQSQCQIKDRRAFLRSEGLM